jgi:archaellum biogenesis ATPase FlaH
MIILIDLLYLNVFIPLTLSFEQVLLIAASVVKICDKKGIDVSTLSPDQLDELITLSITSGKQVFKENRFRLFLL